MRRASFSSVNCLFCMGSCKSDHGEDGGVRATFNFPGAGNCKLLSKQLEQIFITRKLLGLSDKWCVQILQEFTVVNDKEKGGGGGVDCWFNICEECSKRRVQPALEIHWKMMALEKKMNGLRDEIRGTMKENILRNKRDNKSFGLVGNGVDVKIRECIFPDLIVQKLKEAEAEVTPSLINSGESKVDSQDEDWEPPSIDDYFDNDLLNSPPPPPPPPKINKVNINKTVRKKRIWKRKPRRPRESLQRFLCPKCGCYFRTNEDLASHLTAHEESEHVQKSTTNFHVCSKCTFPARSLEELEGHQKRRHNRNRYFICPRINCGYKAPSFIKLQQHMKQLHLSDLKQEEISLQCEACPRNFSRLEQFVIHQKKMHPELFGMESKEPLECDKCGQKFLNKIRFEYHVINEHTEKPVGRFMCDLCGKGFQWRSRLESHKTSHFKKVKRDFVCHLCGVDYSLKVLLQKHYKKVHGGEGEGIGGEEEIFKCKYCELRSAYKVVIHRHMEVHKREMGNECKLCGNFYASGQGLKRHLRLNHSGGKGNNVKCPHCRKGFSSQDYMRDHVRNFCRLKNLEVDCGGDGCGVDVPQKMEGF